MITYHIMTEAEKELIAAWTYTGDYEIYNMPSYQEQKAQGVGLGNPLCANNFYSYYDGDVLIGFTNILEEPGEVFIGIGVAPNLCGRGYGQNILELAYKISKTYYPDKPLYLEVRSWNRRAIECYKKAGFTPDGKIVEQETMLGTGQFLRMVKK